MSVVDREALKEALELHKRALPALALELPPLVFGDYKEIVLPIDAAARSVLEGEATGWCEEHKAMDVGLYVPEGFCTIAAHRENPENSRGNCRMVRVVVVPIEEGI